MSSIRFEVLHREGNSGAAEVVPVVDGQRLTAMVHAFEMEAGYETRTVSYGGLIPSRYRFGPLDEHYLGASSRTDGPTAVLGCECGEWGCWPLMVVIGVTDTEVTWSGFEQPFRKERDYQEFGPFVFARSDYRTALDALIERLDAESP